MQRLVLIICILISTLFISSNVNENSVYASVYHRQEVVVPERQKPVIANNEKQIECLADNIYHESKGESYRGQVAVGFVTINRTNNESFPDDICGVVKQKKEGTCQFSWYCNGKKKKESKKKLVDKLEDPEYNRIIELAEDIFENPHKIKDPSLGSLYFHANYIKVKLKGKVVKAKIDKHIFYDIKTKKG